MESDPNWGLTAEPMEASALTLPNTRQKSRTTLDNQKKSGDYVSPQFGWRTLLDAFHAAPNVA